MSVINLQLLNKNPTNHSREYRGNILLSVYAVINIKQSKCNIYRAYIDLFSHDNGKGYKSIHEYEVFSLSQKQIYSRISASIKKKLNLNEYVHINYDVDDNKLRFLNLARPIINPFYNKH